MGNIIQEFAEKELQMSVKNVVRDAKNKTQNTVANGKTGPDLVASCHGEECLQEVMEHRQGYGISDDLRLDSKEVFAHNDYSNPLKSWKRKGQRISLQNVSSSHSERDETIRAENDR